MASADMCSGGNLNYDPLFVVQLAPCVALNVIDGHSQLKARPEYCAQLTIKLLIFPLSLNILNK